MKALTFTIGIMLLGLCGCSDNGVHLAYALEKGAKTLENKPDGRELVIRYEPLTGIHQAYDVIFAASTSTTPHQYGHEFLTVTGKRGGGTAYHNAFVYVAKNIYVTKTNAATFLTLRKNGSRVELVDVH